MKNLLSFAGFAAVVALAAQPLLAQSGSGQVRALTVTGFVQLMDDVDNTRSLLRAGDTFQEGYTVVTGDDGRAVLVLSNGAAIVVEANTSLSVETLLQDPFPPSLGSFQTLSADPSLSDTNLFLNYGEIVGKVKPLRPGSNFEVSTPVGVAGVRGTTFRIRYVAGTGAGSQPVVIVAVSEGSMGGTLMGQNFNVDGGEEFEATGTEQANGEVVLSDSSTSTLSYDVDGLFSQAAPTLAGPTTAEPMVAPDTPSADFQPDDPRYVLPPTVEGAAEGTDPLPPAGSDNPTAPNDPAPDSSGTSFEFGPNPSPDR